MNRRRRLPTADKLTPQAYRCPACYITARMQIEWPSWVCQVCKAKLVPADMNPRPSDHTMGRPPKHDEPDIVIEMSDGQVAAPAEPPSEIIEGEPSEQPPQPERKAST